MQFKGLVYFCILLLCTHIAYARPLTKQEQIESLSKKAAEQFNTGQYSEAEQTYKKVISIDSSNAYAYSNLGLVYTKQKRLDKASEHAGKALALKPDNAEYLANMGFVHISRKQYEEAEKILRKAVEKDNQLFNGFLWLAEVSRRQKKYHHDRIVRCRKILQIVVDFYFRFTNESTTDLCGQVSTVIRMDQFYPFHASWLFHLLG